LDSKNFQLFVGVSKGCGLLFTARLGSSDARNSTAVTAKRNFSLRSDPCFDLPLALSRDPGVIDMALLSVIRRWHFRQQIPIREI
jgi:hypothetical protein